MDTFEGTAKVGLLLVRMASGMPGLWSWTATVTAPPFRMRGSALPLVHV